MFRKVHQICLKKRDMDSLVTYSTKQAPSKKFCKNTYMYVRLTVLKSTVSTSHVGDLSSRSTEVYSKRKLLTVLEQIR